MDSLIQAVKMIQSAKHVTAFSGAGISVESGIPPFRGVNGLWNKYNPQFLEIDYFLQNPKESWALIKEIFYDFFGNTKPNPAHYALAKMEEENKLQAIVTQNIDNLHQRAGSKNVLEFHGTSQSLSCVNCSTAFAADTVDLSNLPPLCNKCGGLLKPDFIFFGEAIPEPANRLSFREAELADIFLVIGTTGEIMPASMIPTYAKQNGAKIIEVNIEHSAYTNVITDIFLPGKASEVMEALVEKLGFAIP